MPRPTEARIQEIVRRRSMRPFRELVLEYGPNVVVNAGTSKLSLLDLVVSRGWLEGLRVLIDRDTTLVAFTKVLVTATFYALSQSTPAARAESLSMLRLLLAARLEGRHPFDHWHYFFDSAQYGFHPSDTALVLAAWLDGDQRFKTDFTAYVKRNPSFLTPDANMYRVVLERLGPRVFELQLTPQQEAETRQVSGTGLLKLLHYLSMTDNPKFLDLLKLLLQGGVQVTAASLDGALTRLYLEHGLLAVANEYVKRPPPEDPDLLVRLMHAVQPNAGHLALLGAPGWYIEMKFAEWTSTVTTPAAAKTIRQFFRTHFIEHHKEERLKERLYAIRVAEQANLPEVMAREVSKFLGGRR